jgi:predicted DCC family thiol-disulfide oxidoreductase YuxK
MNPAQFTTPALVKLPLTVYYDHSCILCRSEIENLAVRDEEGLFKMMDCSAADFDAQQLPFDQITLMNCIHAVDAKGEWLKATDVFIVCYQVVQLRSVARVFAWAKPLLERIYPWIARHRHVLTFLGAQHFFQRLTRRHLNRKAKQALANSAACQDQACTVKPTDKTL